MFVNIYKPEGMLIGTEENREFLSSQTGIERAAAGGKMRIKPLLFNAQAPAGRAAEINQIFFHDHPPRWGKKPPVQ